MRRKDERGSVTAEAAVVIPVLAIVALAMVWLVSLAVTQVVVLDAAREVARGVTRGDDEAEALAVGRRVAPDGAKFSVTQDDGTVTVEVTAPVGGPGGILGYLGSYDVTAAAAALLEEER